MDNLLDAIPDDSTQEQVFPLVAAKGARIERIVSRGQASPPGFWYDQDLDEWVALLAGSAGLCFEDEPGILELRPGDHVLIPAHRRHRVEWTDAARPTIWLAVHFS
jgi:cupin 2 domain-containing protein